MLKQRIKTWFDPLMARVSEDLWPRYHALQKREQNVLKVAALFLPIIILVFGVILPLQDQRKSLEQDLLLQLHQVEEAEKLATRLVRRGEQTKSGVVAGSLLSQVDALVADQGVRAFVTKMRPQSGMDGKQRLQLLMKNVPYSNVAGFLLALDDTGLNINTLKIRAAKASGYVQLQLLLERL